MPITAVTMKTQLAAVAQHPKDTALQSAQAWADAIAAGFAGIVPPSAGVVSGKAALAAGFATAFASPSAAPGMELAMKTYALTIGLGMLASNFTATPPPGPVGFATLFAPPYAQDFDSAALKLANAIVAWATTGIAISITTPPVTSPWS